MGAIGNLEVERKAVIHGLDSIVIRNYVAGIIGGKTLDMTGFEGVKKITGREDIPFYQIDCCDYESVDKLFTEHQIDAVIHFAAFKAVGESVAQPIMYYRNNLVSFLNILEVAKNHGGCNVLFSSSATVYGEAEVLPVTEQTPRLPATSPYGNTKQMCEDIIRDVVAATAGTDGVIKGIALRYFNLSVSFHVAFQTTSFHSSLRLLSESASVSASSVTTILQRTVLASVTTLT